nr:recombinase family protein [Bacillus sp. 95MFCvi2.1]
MRKIGYVRVSSVDQNPKRQLQQMKEIIKDELQNIMKSMLE